MTFLPAYYYYQDNIELYHMGESETDTTCLCGDKSSDITKAAFENTSAMAFTIEGSKIKDTPRKHISKFIPRITYMNF